MVIRCRREDSMPDHAVFSREEWVVARKELLEKEKQLTRLEAVTYEARP
jgi:predicted dithiol-disulfide oxidoreductase (DUF899 family)